MEDSKQRVLKSLFEGLQLKFISSNYRQIGPTWNKPEFLTTFCRLYMITEGQAWMKIGDDEIIAEENQLVLVPSETLFSYSFLKGIRVTKYWCHFSAMLGNMDFCKLIQFPVFVKVKDVPYVKSLFDGLLQSNQQPDDITAPLSMHSRLTELIVYYVAMAGPSNLKLYANEATNQYGKIHSYIEEHLFENITLEQLAAVFNYSPNYFLRYFKNLFELSPHQYITKIRMDKAQTALLSTETSIIDVAESIGMTTMNFSKMFKKYTSFTPTEFRRMGHSAAFKKDDAPSSSGLRNPVHGP